MDGERRDAVSHVGSSSAPGRAGEWLLQKPWRRGRVRFEEGQQLAGDFWHAAAGGRMSEIALDIGAQPGQAITARRGSIGPEIGAPGEPWDHRRPEGGV